MHPRRTHRLILLSWLAGCSGAGPPPPPGEALQSTKPRITAPAVDASQRAQLAHDRAQFAVELYREAIACDRGTGPISFVGRVVDPR